jgi:hypothetical protein
VLSGGIQNEIQDMMTMRTDGMGMTMSIMTWRVCSLVGSRRDPGHDDDEDGGMDGDDNVYNDLAGVLSGGIQKEIQDMMTMRREG